MTRTKYVRVRFTVFDKMLLQGSRFMKTIQNTKGLHEHLTTTLASTTYSSTYMNNQLAQPTIKTNTKNPSMASPLE